MIRRPHLSRVHLAARGLVLGALTLLAACGSTEPPPSDTHSATRASPAPKAEAPSNAAVAYFAGGCFWGVEHFLELIDGVYKVESGYMGGRVRAPTYRQVTSKTTGHAETVRVTYDPQRVDYRTLAKRFFEIHDPTQSNRQGPDIGPQYRSAIFVSDEAERATVGALVAALRARGYDVATEVQSAGEFWLAEDYHQDYYVRTGKQPYCHTPVPRFDRDAR